MLVYKDLQDEVKRRAVRDQAGTQFDANIKNLINSNLFRVGREAAWRVMRRKTYFTTVTTYDTGSGNGSYTNASTGITITGATFLTDGIDIGRRIKLSGDGNYHIIREIGAESALVLDKAYSGTPTSTNVGTYSILGQEEYNVPVQAGHRMFMWHEEYGYPYKLEYIPDQRFYGIAWNNTAEAIPTHYRMWGADMVIDQPKATGGLRVFSSASGDTGIDVTIFGTVSSYPDYETVTTDGTDGTAIVSTSKTFSKIERIVKGNSTDGRITISADAGLTTVAVLPVGDTTGGIMYQKLQLYPLPNTAFDIIVQYYKDPYRLVNDDDIHELGQEFDEAIILLSVAKLKYENDQKEGDRWLAMYKDEMRSLKKNNSDKIDWFPTLQRPRVRGGDLVHPNLLFRQIGPYYGRSSRY